MNRTARPRAILVCGTALALIAGAPALAQTVGPDASAPSPDRANPPPVQTPRPGTSPRPGDNSTNLEEVVITARKRVERLIDVPVAANALSAQALDKYAVTDLTTAALQVPQVRIDHAASGNGAIITIRGVGSASVDASIEQEVTVNIDGVPVSRGRVIQQAFFDEQSIEVLKGPQALYFGKNSPAGVISITSADPAKTFEGYARVGWEENTDEYYGELAASLPITDTLGVRIALRGSDMEDGYTKGIGGPITNPAQLPAYLAATGITLPGSPYTEYPADKEQVGRITVKWAPNEKFDALLKFLVADHLDRGDSMSGRMFSCGPVINHPASVDIGTGFTTLLVDPYGACNINAQSNSFGTLPPQIAAHYRGSNGGKTYTQVLTYLGSLTLNYHLTPDITITSVSGLDKYKEIQFSNYDETVFAAASGQNNDYNTTFTQEIRAQSSFRTPINFTAGVFYEHDDREFYQQGSIGYLPPDPATGNSALFGSDDRFHNNTYSVFGELNIKLPYRIELAGGARYTEEDKKGFQETTYLNPLVTFLSTPVGLVIPNAFTEHNVSPQVTLSWHPFNNVLLYGAYKTGFKSGGISAPALIPTFAATDPSSQRFKEETVEGGELGAKASNLLNGRLTGDITLYRYTYSGLQLTAFDAATTSYFTQNAAGATTEGVEVNANFNVSRDFSVHGSIGYNRARYDDFPDSQCWTGQPVYDPTTGQVTAAAGVPAYAQAELLAMAGGRYCVNGVQNLSGVQLSRAPDVTAEGGFSYDRLLDPSRGLHLGITGDIRYTDGYEMQTNNNPYGYQKAYTLGDLSARLYDDVWEVAIIARNIANVQYGVLSGDKPLGPAGQILAGVGLPRQVFFQLTRKF